LPIALPIELPVDFIIEFLIAFGCLVDAFGILFHAFWLPVRSLSNAFSTPLGKLLESGTPI